MNAGPVYHPIPEGADLLTRLSYYLEYFSISTSGGLHFLFLAVPPLFGLGCIALARMIPWRPAQRILHTAAILGPVVALRPFFHSTWVLAPWQFCLFLAPLLSLRNAARRPLRARLYRTALASTWVLSCLPLLNIFFTFNLRDRCDDLTRSPQVRAIFSLCGDQWTSVLSGISGIDTENLRVYTETRTIFLSSDGRTVFVSFGYEDEPEPQPFLAIDRDTLEIAHAEAVHAVFGGFCIPNEGKCVTVHPYESGLRILNDSSFQWERQVPLPFKPRFFVVSPTGKTAYFPGSGWNQLLEIDLQTTAYKDHSVVGPTWIPASSAAHDPTIDRLFTAGEYHSRRFLRYADGPGYLIRGMESSWHDYLLHLGTSVGLAIDLERRELYVAMTFTGDLLIYDMDRLTSKGSIRLEPGLRELAYDPSRRLLYAGNYLTGYLHVVDMSTRRERPSIFLGRRIRRISYEPRIDRVLATSANGFFEISGGE